jgi:hypothetical protein
MAIRKDWSALYDGASAAHIRSRPAGAPVFVGEKTVKTLTPVGWFSVLCVAAVAVGATLALAT